MSVLLQISDPHFGTEQAPVMAALTALAREIEPGLIVVSGDITQRARRGQFEAARRFIAQLPAASILVVPGNHDMPLFNIAARAFAPYANYVRVFGDNLEPEYESDALLVLGVNTTRPGRRKDGELSEHQITRVAKRLRSAKREQLRVVVTHQPLQVVRKQDIANLLHGHEHAVREWAAAGADILMGGHIHLPYVRQLAESFVGLRKGLWTVQAGTALSTRVRDGVPNSVNLVRYSADGSLACSVERWDYDASDARFHCFKAQTLELERL
jgi:3',5'-cyclic AMP phosphodiesterase CpdA